MIKYDAFGHPYDEPNLGDEKRLIVEVESYIGSLKPVREIPRHLFILATNHFKQYVYDNREKTESDRDNLRKANVLDGDVLKIEIATTNGVVEINTKEKDYKIFTSYLKLLKKNYSKYLSDFDKYIDTQHAGSLFYLYKILNDNTDLNHFNINVIIGIFIIHFEPGNTKIKRSKEEWEKDIECRKSNSMGHASFYHYLNSIVYSRFKKINKHFVDQTVTEVSDPEVKEWLKLYDDYLKSRKEYYRKIGAKK